MVRKETITTIDIAPTTITGPKETGGVITGDPSRDIKRGGRGGRSVTRVIQPSAEEARLRAIEDERIRVEQIKAREFQQEQRESRAQAGTIEGQLGDTDFKQIGGAVVSGGLEGRFEGSLRGEGTSVVDVSEDRFVSSDIGLGTAFGLTARRLLTGKKDPFSPFKQAEKQKFEKESGQIISEDLLGQPVRFEGQTTTPRPGETATFGEVQEFIEEKRETRIGEVRVNIETQLEGSVAKVQEKIDSGEITFEEGQRQAQKLSSEASDKFQSKVQTTFKDIQDVPGIDVRRSKVERTVETIGSAILFETGIGGAISAKEDPLILTESGAIDFKPRVETLIGLVGPIAGVGGRLARTGAQLERLGIEEAIERASLSQRGIRIPEKGGAIDIVSGRAVLGESFADIQSVTATRQLPSGAIEITGQRQVVAGGRQFFSQKPFVTAITEDISGTAGVLPKTPTGEIPFLGTTEARTTRRLTLRQGRKQPRGEFNLFLEDQPVTSARVSGFSVSRDGVTRSAGGEISEAQAGVIEGRGGGLLGVTDISVEFPIQQASIIRQVRNGGVRSVGTGARGTGRPSSPLFETPTPQITQTPQVTTLPSPASALFTPTRTPARTITSQVGAGVTTQRARTRQEISQQTRLSTQQRQQSPLFATSQLQPFSQGLFQPTSLREGVRQRPIQRQIQRPVQDLLGGGPSPLVDVGLGGVGAPGGFILPPFGRLPRAKVPKARRAGKRRVGFSPGFIELGLGITGTSRDIAKAKERIGSPTQALFSRPVAVRKGTSRRRRRAISERIRFI